MTSGVKRTHPEFIQDFKKNKNALNISILGVYINTKTPILCKCKKCDYEWTPTPKSLLNGHGCPKCAKILKLSNEEFLQNLKLKNSHFDNIIFIDSYKRISSKIKCKCKVCGTNWEPSAKDLLYKNSGCPSCSGNLLYTNGKFLQLLAIRNAKSKKFDICSKYNGMQNRIKCRCKICGTEWEPLASSLMQGSGCPNCAKIENAKRGRAFLPTINTSEMISHEEFINRLKSKNPYFNQIEFLENYKGSTNTIQCKCKICGLVWKTLATTLMQGTGCPACAHSSTSFMEQFVLNSLIYVLGAKEVVHRNKTIIGSELDIYLPKYKLAIEIGSWNWHKNIYENDLNKIKQCKNMGIKLITFYDSCKEKPSKILKNTHFYVQDIGSEKNYNTLKQIVALILKSLKIELNLSSDIWKDIIKMSYKKSQKINHEDFLIKFKKQNPKSENIKLLTKYTRARDYIHCECKICGNKWFVEANELLRGRGCPICIRQEIASKKSKKRIISDWRKKHPSGSKLLCEKETGISRVTVYKWWNTNKES